MIKVSILCIMNVSSSEILTSIPFSKKISVTSRICCGPNAAFYLIVRFLIPQPPNITDQNLALLVVLDNSSCPTNLETKSVPDVYAHLLQKMQFLFRTVVTSSKYPPTYTAKRTTSKKFTKCILQQNRFLIVITIEKHVMICFEIGGHQTSQLFYKK
jgi:hypothetical protein